VLKSGTNQVHGTAYEYLRHDKLNSRNFFETLPGSQKSPFKNSNFGGTLGAPIKHDRTFVFAAYESERGRPNSTLAVSVPATRPSPPPARQTWPPAVSRIHSARNGLIVKKVYIRSRRIISIIRKVYYIKSIRYIVLLEIRVVWS
jgi:hypothetical protein